ncbi:diuretic hormone receptor isoform X1 [Glossina fuscipes]|uniref:Diuretic hormone receptor n=1 Tax=Glossina fuscipes TaxID=7396 RepID=A0A9C6DYK1_9MUSC|nr:diuretic hormone receptor isoform X1 [Glossina fuscipes]
MDTIDLDSLVGKLAEDVTKNDVAFRWKNFSNVDAQLENTFEEDDKLRDVLEVIVAALTNRDSIVNHTLELQCLQQQKFNKIIDELKREVTTNNSSCPVSFDSVLCWPSTPAGAWAALPCFKEFKGVRYDNSQNATRYCHSNGTWDIYTNYDKCHNVMQLPEVPDFAPGIELPTYIYCCGYSLSLLFLTLALIVFLSFKDLKCLRNTIHANLFLTYILSALLWILTLFLQVMTDHASEAGCITLVMMFHYFNLTNFFWMFVEGLYLYTLVVQTFTTDNLGALQYALIGWGCPAVVTIVWSIVKIYTPHLENESFIGLTIDCSWMRESQVDWIFQGPASLVLLLNLIFLVRIMWVLITKLRSANTLETRQYRKAAKALLVLIPLFGITYLLVLVGPEQGLSRNLFEIIRAFLISTQGFFVSLFFCFLNSEVRQTLRHRFDRWREHRNLGTGSMRRAQRYHPSKDYSQRSRTESLRLTSASPSPLMNVE